MSDPEFTSTVPLPPPLVLAGRPPVRFRRLASAADHAGMAAVRQGSIAHDQIDLYSSREGIPSIADIAATFPLDDGGSLADLLIADAGEELIGYAQVRWRWTEVTGERVYLHLGHVLPAWRGQGIGSAMMIWSQERIRELVAIERPEGPIRFASNASSTEREAMAMLRDFDYSVVRTLSDMTLDLRAPASSASLPVGFDRRPLVPAQDRAVYDAWKDADTVSWMATSPSEADFRTFVADNFGGDAVDRSLCQVAWAGDEVAGLVLGQIAHVDGTRIGIVAEVSVRRRWQRRGIARALMTGILHAFREHDVRQARLYTDAANGQGARTLYEQLGFREVKQHLLYRRPLDALDLPDQ